MEVFWPGHSQGRERVGTEPGGGSARALTFSKVARSEIGTICDKYRGMRGPTGPSDQGNDS